MLSCSRCKAEKPEDCFRKRSARPRGYASYCKDCSSMKDKESRDKYRERYNQEGRRYYSENRENRIQGVLASRQKNLQSYLLTLRKWEENNPEKVRLYNANKAVKKRTRVPSWLTVGQKAQIANFYWLATDLYRTCGEKYHVDHIIPLSGKNVCGLHVPWNLQVLPSDINIKKSNKLEGALPQ